MHIEIAFMGVLMGIAFAAPPGAVTAETFRRGVRGGFPLAFGVQLGSLIGDATYALLAFAGLAALAQNLILQVALGALGAMFLLYLAWGSFQSALTPMTIVGKGELLQHQPTLKANGFTIGPNSSGSALSSHGDAAQFPMSSSEDALGVERRGAFLSGLALSLTNPWAIAFWLSLGSALVSMGLTNASARQMAFFFASFMLGSAVWALLLSFAIARVRRWIRPALFRAVSIACGVALGSFALIAVSRVMSSIMGS